MPANVRFCKGNDMFVTWVSLCFVLAVILAFEQHFHPDRGNAAVTPELRLIMIAMLGASIALQTETFRGFLIVWLSSIGAYRITKLSVDWLLSAVGFKYRWNSWRGSE